MSPPEPPSKRRKVIVDDDDNDDNGDVPEITRVRSVRRDEDSDATAIKTKREKLKSLARDISPPPLRGHRPNSNDNGSEGITPLPTPLITSPTPHLISTAPPPIATNTTTDTKTTYPLPGTNYIPSPITLTTIDLLPPHQNLHSTTLTSLLTPPTPSYELTSLWNFNYLHSIPFLRYSLPAGTNSKRFELTIIHGSWKREDNQRIRLEEERKADEVEHGHTGKVRLVTAYMPEPFGTHHSKMMVCFASPRGSERQEGGGDLSEGGSMMMKVIIHTANSIPFDWGNMTQGVWSSGWLPLLLTSTQQMKSNPIGVEFKQHLLAYLCAYGTSRTGPLTTLVEKFDFSSVRAVFLGSVPGRWKVKDCDFGWPGLKKLLSRVPVTSNPRDPGKLILQLSSIASLGGGGDTWFTPVFLKSLFTTSSTSTSLQSSSNTHPKPEISLIFPTPDEVRLSLNGYRSGNAIHLKNDSPAQKRQVDYLKRFMYRWGASMDVGKSSGPLEGELVKHETVEVEFGEKKRQVRVRESGRATGAPHVKTYIRFNGGGGGEDEERGMEGDGISTIAWALLTSANLSMQAWGSGPIKSKPSSSGNKKSRDLQIPEDEGEMEVRLCSYEAGVLVYPGLWEVDMNSNSTNTNTSLELSSWDDGDDWTRPVRVEMHPIFSGEEEMWQCGGMGMGSSNRNGDEIEKKRLVVGLRMPYDMPLRKYRKGDEPWWPGGRWMERDWLGERWDG